MEKEKTDIFSKKYDGIYLCDFQNISMANDGYDIFEYCRRNDVEGLKTLFIRLDANINGKDECGDTPLHIAAHYNSKECLQLLLEAEADPNAKDGEGDTPLQNAAWYNSKECLQLLLETGADPNIKNNRGYTPLHYAAARYSSKECLELLLEAGADPNIKNNNESTPLELIRDANFRKEMEEYINALSTFNIKEPSC